MTTKIVTTSLLLFIGITVFAQNKGTEFYADCNGTIDKKVNAICFRTPNSIDAFTKALQKKLGTPVLDDYFSIYTYQNKKWAKQPVIIRMETSVDLELDNTEINSVSIYAETKDHTDLLDHQKKTYNTIKNYLFNLYKKTIKDAH